MSYMIWLAKALTPDYYKVAKNTNSIQVVTIAFSHYCELACWSLRLGGKKYEERGYAAGQHVLPALRVRVCGKQRHFSNSSRVTSAKEFDIIEKACGNLTEDQKKYLKKRESSSRSTAVPVAVCPDGRVLRDSWEIAEYSGLAPISPDLYKLIDDELGPLTRQAVYAMILKPENIYAFNSINTKNRIWIWRFLFNFFFANYLVKTLVKLFNPRNTEAVKTCKQKLDVVLGKLDDVVSKRKGRYLEGDSITLADVALASLVAPIVLPPLYCEGKFNDAFQSLYDKDPEVKSEVDRWRRTATGQYALQLYADHRLA